MCYVQSKPERKVEEFGEWRQLTEAECGPDNDGLLCYLARFPLHRNHPRRPIYHWDLKRSGEVVFCYESDFLPEVFNELITQGFQGCPVLNADRKYVGFVDMLDITKAVLKAFGVYRADRAANEEEFAYFTKSEAFTRATVKQLLEDIKKEGAVMPQSSLLRSYSLLSATELMARENMRRIPFTNSDGTVRGIVTQSMIISLLDQNTTRLGNIRYTKVSSMIPSLKERIISCRTTDVVYSAFLKIAEHGITGLPVVNDKGELKDCLSTRDLRILGNSLNHFLRLYFNVNTFKQSARMEFQRQTPALPIFVQETDTIEDVIRAMDDGNIHRVYVAKLNNAGNPVPTHVISQRDVLRYLIYHCGMDPACLEDLPGTKF